MNSVDLKKLKSSRGFTIVELLVVIVVIGILASITIVAYNGVTARANKSAMQAGALSLAKKLEAFNAENGSYPKYNTVGDVTAQLNAVTSAAISGSGLAIKALSTDITATNGTSNFQVLLCGATAPSAGSNASGYKVIGWDYTASPAAVTPAASPVASGGVTTNCVASTSGS